MTDPDDRAGRNLDEQAALRAVVEGTAGDTGTEFFKALVKNLAVALDVHGAWITDYLEAEGRLRARAFWLGDKFVPDYEYAIPGTPCEHVIGDRRLVHVPDSVVELFPADPDLAPLSAVSYMGIPLLDDDGSIMGNLAVLDTRPMPEDSRLFDLLQIFSNRAEAELRRLRAEEQTVYLREQIKELSHFNRILGSSSALLAVLKEVDQVACTDATVLILGETGTGKELIARAIHDGSRRARRPLVNLNCAAIPANLIESELFGHERGAFTGATQRRDGRFTLADRGTLFLDEVGELPLELQGKLLRVLQEGEFEPVGSARSRKVDVRVVAATNRELQDEVAEGRFREDLYYRLNVFPIALPPLRERGDDVILLASEFARGFAQEMGKRLEPFDEAVKNRLRAYPWPGNVRELQNIIERAVITAQAGRLNLARALPGEARQATSIAPPEDSERILTCDELRDLERANIRRALDSCDWKVAGQQGAALRLGMNASTLRSRMRALGIQK